MKVKSYTSMNAQFSSRQNWASKVRTMEEKSQIKTSLHTVIYWYENYPSKKKKIQWKCNTTDMTVSYRGSKKGRGRRFPRDKIHCHVFVKSENFAWKISFCITEDEERILGYLFTIFVLAATTIRKNNDFYFLCSPVQKRKKKKKSE